MDQLRIAFFIDELKPGAGTENQLLRQLRGLDRKRFKTWLITLRKPVPEAIATNLPCEIDCLRLGSLISPGSVVAFWKLLRRLRRDRIDIAMLYFVDSNLFVAPAAKWAGVKAVVVNRRDMGYWYTERLLKYIRKAHRFVDYILVNARAIKEKVAVAEKFPAERIKVILNGLVVEQDDSAELTHESLGFGPEALVVGIVANLRPVKQLDHFLQAAAIVYKQRPEARFVVIGSGDLLGPLQTQAKALGIGDKVVFTGSIKNVTPYLRLFDIGLLTSASEGLSNTLMEYSYHSVPIVAYDTGGNGEVIADGDTGYLVPLNDIDTLAGRTLELLSDPTRREAFGQAGRARVERVFSPGGTLRELEEFFEQIVKAGPRRISFDSSGDPASSSSAR